MSARVLLLVVLVLAPGCGFNPAADPLSAAPTAADCLQGVYKHKSVSEISSLSSAELFDEMVKEQTFHPATTWEQDDDYGSRLGDAAAKRPASEILPEFVRGLDSYDPTKPPICNDIAGVGLFIASATASDIDNGVFRLRASAEGRNVMAAMERGLERMRQAGFNDPNHKLHSRYSLTAHHLEMARGTNIRDEIISYTLKNRHKIEMTPAEQVAYSNCLTSLDPGYPRWSQVHSAGTSAEMKDTDRYLAAFRQFKKK